MYIHITTHAIYNYAYTYHNIWRCRLGGSVRGMQTYERMYWHRYRYRYRYKCACVCICIWIRMHVFVWYVYACVPRCSPSTAACTPRGLAWLPYSYPFSQFIEIYVYLWACENSQKQPPIHFRGEHNMASMYYTPEITIILVVIVIVIMKVVVVVVVVVRIVWCKCYYYYSILVGFNTRSPILSVIHWKMPLKVHWEIPVKIHRNSRNPLENTTEQWNYVGKCRWKSMGKGH